MNGELDNYVSCALCAKHFLRTGELIPPDEPYVEAASFAFTTDPPSEVSVMPWDQAVTAWVTRLRDLRASDVWLFANWAKQNLDALGFIGGAANRWAVACQSPSGATGWASSWTFNQATNRWTIRYTEITQPTPLPKAQPDPSEQLHATLTGLNDLATRIGEDHWAKWFAKADRTWTDPIVAVTGPRTLPERYHRLWTTAQQAWVFGGMGSWNDDAQGAAQQAGLSTEYDALSRRLYEHIVQVALVAVNAW